jgi:hypothetical protein
MTYFVKEEVEMKKRFFVLTGGLAAILPLLIASLSFSAITERKALLGDRHKAAKISCKQCHKESPPKEPVSTAVCLGCHKDYAKPPANVATGKPNPHTSHPGQGFTQCNVCHHAHKPSEDGCKPCHDFGFQVP